MELISSLRQSLLALEQCIQEDSDIIINLERYAKEAEASSNRVRRSFLSIFPFGEFRAGRVPIHDNAHTAQRDAFIQRFLKPLHQQSEWETHEQEVLQSALDILYPSDTLDPSQVDWNRVANQCKQLSRKFLRSAASCQIEFVHNIDSLGSKEWTEEEDTILTSLVTQFNGTNWEEIGRRLNRTPASCFKRCYSNLHPVLVPTDFTKQDDDRLLNAIDRLGEVGWAAIAAELGTGHTDRQCMTRFTKTLQPGIQSGKWNPVLDSRLKAAVAIFGERSWVQVAKYVPGKTDRKCRERYFDNLKEGLRPANEWTNSEDEALETAVRKHGVGKWSKVADELEGRTDYMCRLRFRKLSEDVKSLSDLKQQYEEQLTAKRESKLARTRGSAPSYTRPRRPRGRPRTPEGMKSIALD
jgi:hypothetical protein